MIKIISFLSLVLLLSGCNVNKDNASDDETAQASIVELRNTDGKYRLYLNEKEFFVHGAGLEFGEIQTLAEHGANSFGTWRIDNGQVSGKEVLDEAQKNGLMVLMGIDVGRERQGFDYDDSLLVQSQFKQIKKDVESLKDHPALLGWGIGNELNLHYKNPKVWDAVQEIAAMIHEVDGNHPTTTMMAGIGKTEVDYIMANCPDLDFLSIQMYGDIINLEQRIEDAGYKGPYLVTEWGATGHWEVGRTEWDVAIEQTSSEKADAIAERYTKAIISEENMCLGSYVFLWGQKQERTPTWYGLFTEDNDRTEAIDVMFEFWNGYKPENSCPSLISQKLDGKDRYDNIYLKTGQEYTIDLDVKDPDNDELKVRIEVLKESIDLGMGGDHESRPEVIEGLVVEASSQKVLFKAPGEEGAYRIFVYILDGHQHAATVNFPFYVK
ncbi:hypothetical protein KAJ27_18650 [bacterium]|nr:hypothetical protein [bacterium]